MLIDLSGESPLEPNLIVIATGILLCRRPRLPRRSERSSSVAPFAKMNDSAPSSNTAVTRSCPKRCSGMLRKGSLWT